MTAILRAVLALAVFTPLVGCASLPDLAPTTLDLTTGDQIRVRIDNQGDGAVPERGSVRLFVDGKLAAEYSLDGWRFGRGMFRAGGSTVFSTGVRIAGEGRRVGVVVDPERRIQEVNEFQNTLTRTLTPGNASGPDWAIVGLTPSPSLTLEIANLGDAPAPARPSAIFTIQIDGAPADSFRRALPALAPGATITVTLTVSPPTEAEVRARLTVTGPEIDLANNLLVERLPQRDAVVGARVLLTDRRLRRVIRWRTEESDRFFDDWSAAEQQRILEAVARIERGEEPGLTGPPPIVSGLGNISLDDGWTMFVARIAQSLWFEVERAVGWSLFDLSDEDRALLFDSRRLMWCYEARDECTVNDRDFGKLTPWSPRVVYEFMSSLGLIRDTPRATAFALTDWMRGRLSHADGFETVGSYTAQWGYPWFPPVDRVLYPIAPRATHLTQGCWGTSALYDVLLASVNIPVATVQAAICGNHKRPVMPSLGLTMPHGDDPYNGTMRPSSGVEPPLRPAADRVLWRMARYRALFAEPTVECEEGGERCNSECRQAGVNLSRHQLRTAVDFRLDPLVLQYVEHGAAYLDDSLRGPRSGGVVVERAQPYFPAEERAGMVAEIADWVRRQGSGDPARGGERVRARWQRFSDNLRGLP